MNTKAKMTTTSSTTEIGLMRTLRNSFHMHWPAWKTMRGNQAVKYIAFTLTLNDKFKIMSSMGGSHELIDETMHIFEKVCALREHWGAALNDVMCSHLEDTMIEAICREIFHGKDVKADDYDERDADYAKSLGANPSADAIVRSRGEIIQHAKALDHIIKAIVENSEPLTEQLIKSTHIILCEGQDLDHPAGSYRDYEISARYGKMKPHKFMASAAVPEKMDQLCNDYNNDITMAETSQCIDPMSLAARYCSAFVNIHPFADGNGRMCRLILNAILLKYAGICIPIGEKDDEDRQEYIDLTNRASKKFRQEEFDVDKEDETSHLELGVLILKKSRSKLRDLYEKLSQPNQRKPNLD